MSVASSRNFIQTGVASNTYCQSTPAPTKIYSSIKDSFDKIMPLGDPPSPIATSNQPKKHKNEADKNEPKKLPMIDMVCKAIEELANGRKGSSVPAIKKWIMSTYNYDADGSLNFRIRKALAKGLENGTLDRSTKSAQLTGAKGFFVIKPKVKKEKPKVPKTKKPTGPPKGKAKPNYASDSEVTIIKSDNRRKTKQHASDTDLPPEEDVQLKPKKVKKKEGKESKKQTSKEVPKKAAKPKSEKAKPGKPVKAGSTKSKEKKAEGEAPAKKEKPKKATPKPKKAAEDEAKLSGKKGAKK